MQRREEEAERRHEPEHAEEREEQVHRRAREEADDLRRDGLADDDGLLRVVRGGHLNLPPEAADVDEQDRDHEQEEEHGDRRAEPEVVDAAERRRHIASAITFASSCTEPGATAITMSKTLRT